MTFQGQIDGEKLLDKAESSEVSSVAKRPPLSACKKRRFASKF